MRKRKTQKCDSLFLPPHPVLLAAKRGGGSTTEQGHGGGRSGGGGGGRRRQQRRPSEDVVAVAEVEQEEVIARAERGGVLHGEAKALGAAGEGTNNDGKDDSSCGSHAPGIRFGRLGLDPGLTGIRTYGSNQTPPGRVLAAF